MDSMAFQSLTLLLLRRIEDVDDHAGLSVVSYLDCHIHLVPILPCRGKGMTRRWEASKKKGFKHASLGALLAHLWPTLREQGPDAPPKNTRLWWGCAVGGGSAEAMCSVRAVFPGTSSPQALGGVRICTTFETKVLRLKHPGDTHQHAALP